jgi:hypothetical protein
LVLHQLTGRFFLALESQEQILDFPVEELHQGVKLEIGRLRKNLLYPFARMAEHR